MADALTPSAGRIAWRPLAAAPTDRFLLTHCPATSVCDTWPTAPMIVARWHDDTECWRDVQGIEVHPDAWLELHAPDQDQAASVFASVAALAAAFGLVPNSQNRDRGTLSPESRAPISFTADQEAQIRRIANQQIVRHSPTLLSVFAEKLRRAPLRNARR